LIGKLGREHVMAFVKGKVDTPTDISGVVYVDLDSADAWKKTLSKEMAAAGY
jgi:predicted nucleotide-binding protein